MSTSNICAVALIRKENQVLMGLREYNKGFPVWTFPGGRCDGEESIQSALEREVKEEIGVTDLFIVRLVGEKEGVKSGDKVSFFECSINQEPRLMEPEKFLEWRWFPFDALPQNLIDRNDIRFIKLLCHNG